MLAVKVFKDTIQLSMFPQDGNLRGHIEHPRTPDISWVDGLNLGYPGVGLFSILLCFKVFYR